MLTRQGWLVGLGPRSRCSSPGRMLGSLELYVLGAVIGACSWSAPRPVVALTRLDSTSARELHPPRVHVGTPSRVDLRVRNQRRRRTPVLRLRDPCRARGAPTCSSPPLEPRRVAPAPPTGCPPSAAASLTDRAARGRARRPVRPGPASRIDGAPARRSSPSTRTSTRSRRCRTPPATTRWPAPSTPTRSAAAARTSTPCAPTSSATTCAGSTGRRRPATTSSWCARTSCRGRGAPPCCSTSASATNTGESLELVGLGGGQHRRRQRRAARTSSASSPPTAPTRASPPATPTSRRSWSTSPASRPPTTPASSGSLDRLGRVGRRRRARRRGRPLASAADLERLARLRQPLRLAHDRAVRPVVVGPGARRAPAAGRRRRRPARHRRRLVRRRVEPGRRTGAPGDAPWSAPATAAARPPPRPRPTTGPLGPPPRRSAR